MNDEYYALDNCRNRNQNLRDYKTVLCLCSAGLLRSPTAAFILSNPPYNYNTRSAGVESYALIPLSAPLIEWADIIVCMGGAEHEHRVRTHPHFKARPKLLIVLDIPDRFQYRDEQLIKIIKEKLDASSIQTLSKTQSLEP